MQSPLINSTALVSKKPVIYFNGKVLASRLTSWVWGGSAMAVEENTGSAEAPMP